MIHRYDTDTNTDETLIWYQYRCQWDTDLIPMRYRRDTAINTDELPMRYRWATDEIPMRYRYRCQWYTDNDTEFKVSDTNSVRAKRNAKNKYTTSARCARSERILYYLCEPPGAAFNTIFNGAILSISRNIFYTTSARLPTKRPILFLTEQY